MQRSHAYALASCTRRHLRQRLVLGQQYLERCPHAAEDFTHRRLQQRAHLWQTGSLYSIADLLMVNDDSLAGAIRKCNTHVTEHVYQCNACMRKGRRCAGSFCDIASVIHSFELGSFQPCRTDGCTELMHAECQRGSCTGCGQPLVGDKLAQMAPSRTAAVRALAPQSTTPPVAKRLMFADQHAADTMLAEASESSSEETY